MTLFPTHLIEQTKKIVYTKIEKTNHSQVTNTNAIKCRRETILFIPNFEQGNKNSNKRVQTNPLDSKERRKKIKKNEIMFEVEFILCLSGLNKLDKQVRQGVP